MKGEQAVEALDAARAAFTAPLAAAPDGALEYLRPGDEYALGGLLVHVAAVLEHYGSVLDAMLGAGFGPCRSDEAPGFLEDANALARSGPGPGNRSAAFEALESAHRRAASLLGGVGAADWERKAAVDYGTGEPYPTSPADVAGWLIGHYWEHTGQAAELAAEWAALDAARRYVKG